MLEDIDESQLPDVYGGKQPLIPVQDAWKNLSLQS